MHTITLEEHFVTPAYLEGPGKGLLAGRMAQVADKLCDLGQNRIAEMDAAGVDIQVLSLNSPGAEQLEAGEAIAVARETNDALAAAIRQHPQRFAGFAALPAADPQAAASELQRMVQEHGLKGAAINGHIRSRYLDDPFFWPIFERAEALQAPIYLHPAPPPQPVIQASYTGNFSPQVSYTLATNAWGWHIETAVHVLRIILSGAFDRYPKLQLIIGHLGEALPFMLPRLDWSLPKEMTGLQRTVSAYLHENVNYTFSGFTYTASFLDLLLEVGTDRILFSADYPYQSMASSVQFLEQLPLSIADKERIAHGNAEKLLKM